MSLEGVTNIMKYFLRGCDYQEKWDITKGGRIAQRSPSCS